MGFKKGHSRPLGSGRQKGTPNKRTVAKVADFLGERGINPAEEILNIINEKKSEGFVLKSAARAALWLELLSFCHAKPKSLEIKSESDFDVSEFDGVATEDLMKVVKPTTSGTA